MIATDNLVPVPAREPRMVAVKWIEDGNEIGHYCYRPGLGILVRNRGDYGPPWRRPDGIVHGEIQRRLIKLYAEAYPNG